MRYVVVFFFFLFLCACREKKEPVIPVVRVEADHPEVCRMDQLFYEPEVIFLQYGEDGFLGSVSRIAFFEDKIYILDKKLSSVSIFDYSGEYLLAIRPTGKGPREFDKLMDFFIDEKKKELVLYADRPYKFLYYDLEGKFKREIPGKSLYHEIACGDEGEIIALNVSENAPGYLSLIRQDGEKITDISYTDLPYQGTGSFYTQGAEMNRSENLNFTRRGDNVIYSLKGTKAEPRYRIDFGNRNLPERWIGLREYSPDIQIEIIGKRYVFSIVNIKETPKYLFFNTLLPQTFVMQKEKADLRYYRMSDWTYNVYHNQMVPCWDPENRLIVFSKLISELKKSLSREQMEELPVDYRATLEAADEGKDNPVLFVYRTRE